MAFIKFLNKVFPRLLIVPLPAWTGEKTSLRVVGGDEVIARRIGELPWEVKTERCARCGQCCLYENYKFEYRDHDDKGAGRCRYIETEDVGGKVLYRCGHPEKPWSCVRGSGEDMSAERYKTHPMPEGVVPGLCSIRYKVV